MVIISILQIFQVLFWDNFREKISESLWSIGSKTFHALLPLESLEEFYSSAFFAFHIFSWWVRCQWLQIGQWYIRRSVPLLFFAELRIVSASFLWYWFLSSHLMVGLVDNKIWKFLPEFALRVYDITIIHSAKWITTPQKIICCEPLSSVGSCKMEGWHI